MIRHRAACFVLVAITSLLTWEGPAWAASDPTKIGKNLEDIVTPNVKSLWKIGLIVGVVILIFGRVKASIVVAFFVCIIMSGAIIFNPGGFSEMVKSVGNKIL